jgi:hypothetical protein
MEMSDLGYQCRRALENPGMRTDTDFYGLLRVDRIRKSPCP